MGVLPEVQAYSSSIIILLLLFLLLLLLLLFLTGGGGHMLAQQAAALLAAPNGMRGKKAGAESELSRTHTERHAGPGSALFRTVAMLGLTAAFL